MSIFEYVKSRVSMLDVVKDYSSLKKAGGYWKGRCPFHHEKTASFTVSPHKEIFYCFGCHVSGDVISFIAKVEQCSQFEAVQQLADRYGIEVPEELNAQKKSISVKEKKHYYTVCQVIAQWAHEQLFKDKVALEYMRNRAIANVSMQQFMIGYFPGGLGAIKQLLNYAKKQNILSKDLIDAHVIREGRSVLYSQFEDRILFPIRDHLGRYCGFGGRVFKEQDTRAKYYNSHENDFFSKGTLLFGLDSAKKAIQDKNEVYLVEGYTDCIAMVQHGFTNTVATLGTACTEYHLKQLSRYADCMYVVYDADSAGHKAVLRLTQLCWQVSMELKVVTLPAETDPFSFLFDGGDMAAKINAAQDIFLFFIDSVGSSFRNKPLAKKLGALKGLLEAIASLDDPLKQDLLLQEASRSLDISFDALARSLSRMGRVHEVDSSSEQSHELVTQSNQQAGTLEKKLMCAILNDTSLLNDDNVLYLTAYLSRPFCTIVRLLFATQKSGSEDSFKNFHSTLTSEQQQYVSNLLMSYEPCNRQEFTVLFGQWQQKQWKVIVIDIKAKIAQAKNEGDEKRVRELLDEFVRLKQVMITKQDARAV